MEMIKLLKKICNKLLRCVVRTARIVKSCFQENDIIYLAGSDAKYQLVNLGSRLLYADKSDPQIGNVIVNYRVYEPHVTMIIEKRLTPSATFVDIGANIGIFTTLAASIVGDAGQVIAVEPNPNNVEALQASIEKNNYQNITVLPFAASNNEETVLMTSGSSSNSIVIENPPNELRLVEAKTIVLDQKLKFLERIDVVKIDVEGQELKAFLGFKELINRFQPAYISEFHPWAMKNIADCDPKQYLSELFLQFELLYVITNPSAELVQCKNERDVMQEHEKLNKKLGMGERAHLDLLACMKSEQGV